MRTLWITNDLPPRAGGIEQFVANLLVRSWPGEALVVGPARHRAAEHDAAAPYEVLRLDGGVWPTPSTARVATSVARTHRPDAIVLGASWPLGELARTLRRHAPVVALSHGLEAGLADVGLGSLVARATRHLDALTTISDFTERALAPHVRVGHVVRVPPGVDTETFHPVLDGTEMRHRWGVPVDAPVVGCISRLVARKGQDALLAAWPLVIRRHPDAYLVIVGEGPLDAALRSRASGLRNAVVAGPVSWDDLPLAYRALDVFAMPCRTRRFGTDVEGLGIVYLEAQACGVPAIAGRSGGAPETVVEGQTGLTVDGTDPASVAEAIDALLSAPDRARAMGAAGRQHVERSWSWSSIADRFRVLLADVSAPARS